MIVFLNMTEQLLTVSNQFQNVSYNMRSWRYLIYIKCL